MKSRTALLFATVSALSLAIIWGGAAVAAVPQLRGRYAGIGEATCLNAPFGFTANLTPVDGQVYSESFSVEGIWTFNGDGTGTAQARSVGITPPPALPPQASSNDASWAFTYTVNPDGTFTTDLVPGSYLGTILTGPSAGQTYTLDHFRATGRIAQGGAALTSATVEPTVETLTVSNGYVTPRICHRGRVLLRMGP